MSTTNELPIRKVPTDYAWLYFQASWRVVKRNYPIVMAVSVFMLLMFLVLAFIPYVGVILQCIFSSILALGTWTIFKGATEGQPVRMEQVLMGFKDQDYLRRIAPFIVASAGVTIVTETLLWMGTQAGGATENLINFAIVILSFGWMVLTIFAVPLIIFRKIPFLQTIALSFSAFFKNLKVMILLAFLFSLFGFLSVLLLVLPVFFIYIPIVMSSGYIVYASIFEGLAVEGVQ